MTIISAERAANLVKHTKNDIIMYVDKEVRRAAEEGNVYVVVNLAQFDVGPRREGEVIVGIRKAGYQVNQVTSGNFRVSWSKQLTELQKQEKEKEA